MVKKRSFEKSGFICGVFVLMFVMLTANAWAREIHVDAGADAGGDGTYSSPYRTICEAVENAVSLDVIHVRAGQYLESVTINGQGIKLIGQDPKTTIIRAGTESNTIYLTGAFTSGENVVEISGFTISNATGSGIYTNSTTVIANIHNNIIAGNYYGIRTNSVCTFIISNNLFSSNSSYGVYTDVMYTRLKLYNNIFVDNPAVKDATSSYNYAHVLAYNNNWNSQTVSVVFTGSGDANIGNISLNPQFIDSDAGDFRLSATSPSIDAGREIASDNDPDGTRNDQGVYGGPGAAAFWPESAGGPVVTELSVTPASVASDGTITIRAKAVLP